MNRELGFVGRPGPNDVLGQALVLALVVVGDVADHQVAFAFQKDPEKNYRDCVKPVEQ